MVSEYGSNCLTTMMGAGCCENLNAVDDQIGLPAHGYGVAKAILSVIPHLRFNNKEISVVYKFCGADQCFWSEFAVKIFSEARKAGHDVSIKAQPINTLQDPRPAKKPAYLDLDT